MSQSELALPAGTELEHYRIDSTLSAGGFGIVYLATDLNVNQQIVIKEYMPNKLAQRLPDGFVMPQGEQQQEHHNEGMRLFLQEAAALIKLKHPNIVRVLNFFRANGTVYMVMEYRPGKNLQRYIKNRGGNLSENFLRTIFPPLLEGLRVVHETGFLHLDIKPGNIHLCPGGVPLLLDFGAVHPRNTSRKMQISQVVTAGFSPTEQYNLGGYIGPWTDIYAIGATMRSCIEGVAPVSAKSRHEKDTLPPATTAFKRRYSTSLLQALDWAMEIDPLLRPQTVDEFIEAMNKKNDDNNDLIGKLIHTLTKPL
ncbi:MAG: serine/threonine protein kinase [Ectothiorhodospiraceae bacterium]|nr:serine/threonine protein kinase [Ectothiorhodospiraceae bacterium]